MFVKRKRYKILKTNLRLIKVVYLFENCSLLNFFHIQYFNSLRFTILKETLHYLNLGLLYCDNTLFRKRSLNIPISYISKLILSDILIIYPKNSLSLFNKDYISDIKFCEFNLLPLFISFNNKVLYQTDKSIFQFCIKLKDNVTFDLISILQIKGFSVSSFIDILIKSIAFSL